MLLLLTKPTLNFLPLLIVVVLAAPVWVSACADLEFRGVIYDHPLCRPIQNIRTMVFVGEGEGARLRVEEEYKVEIVKS